MSENLQQIRLLIGQQADDDIRAAEDAISLARALRQLDVHNVELASSGDAPPGTRAVDVVSTGSLLILAASSRVLLRSVLGIVQDWLARRQSGTVSVKIGNDELLLTYASNSDKSKALEEFLARHAK